MGSDDGETLHSFRSGCAITLALSGAELSEIMDHVGWTRRHTALHYLTIIIMEFIQRLYIAFLRVLQRNEKFEKFIAYTSQKGKKTKTNMMKLNVKDLKRLTSEQA